MTDQTALLADIHKAEESAEHMRLGSPNNVLWLINRRVLQNTLFLIDLERKVSLLDSIHECGADPVVLRILDTIDDRVVAMANNQAEHFANLEALVARLLPGQATRLNTYFDAPTPKGSTDMGISTGGHVQQLGDSEQIKGHIKPVDRAGNSAPIEAGSFKVESSDPAILTVEADPTIEGDFVVTAVGPLGGGATITTSADADLGAGIQTITDVVPFEVVPGQAANLGTTFDAPTPKP